jgi:hypothetical protein
MVWRDVVGQFFFFLGTYVFLGSLNQKTVKKLLMIVVASLLMGLLRTVYMFIPFLLLGFSFLRGGVSPARQLILLITTFTGASLVLYNTGLISFLEAGYSSYLVNINGLTFVFSLPLEYVKAIIGPFPWTNWLKFEDNTIFYMANYFQAVYVVTIGYFTIRYYKSNKSDLAFYIILMFLMLLTMSLAAEDVHTEYYSFCAALMLPISIKYLNVSKFTLVYGFVFAGFILLNVMYLVSGIGRL